MTSGYLLVDNPNRTTPQGGLPRRAGGKLSGTIIVHTSEGGWRGGVAALTRFIRTRSDYGSYHRACDWVDIDVYFPWEWETWQDSETNVWAVGIAAACKTSEWKTMPADIREGYYRNMARMAADFVAYMRDVHGIAVPLRRISGAEARARVPGFCAHGDSGLHRSDPGADFDWALFFKYTAELLNAVTDIPAPALTTPKEPFTVAQVDDIIKAINAIPGRVVDADITLPNGKVRKLGKTVGWIDNNVNAGSAALQGAIDGLVGAVAAATSNPAIDPDEIRSILEGAAEKAFGKYELEVRRAAEAGEGK